LCEYNAYGDSHRSPWSNAYFPPIEADGEDDEIIYPSSDLLKMEQSANEVFARYAKMYYDDNFFSSVYFFDTDDNGFGSCWMVKKT
jgi:capping protein beta